MTGARLKGWEGEQGKESWTRRRALFKKEKARPLWRGHFHVGKSDAVAGPFVGGAHARTCLLNMIQRVVRRSNRGAGTSSTTSSDTIKQDTIYYSFIRLYCVKERGK